MPRKELSHYSIRHPVFVLAAACFISLSFLALLIIYASGPPAEASVGVQSPQVSLEVGLAIESHVQDKVLVYEWLTYTLVFTNTSGQFLDNVVITDTWTTNGPGPEDPAEYNGNLTDPFHVVDSYTWTVGTDAGALYINVGTLSPNVAATVVFTMGVPDGLEPNFKDPTVGPSILGNSVDIGTSTPGIENAHHTANTVVVGPVLKLVKAVETESGLDKKERPGRLVTYTLSLRNCDEDDDRPDSWPATQVEVWEDIPGDLSFIDAQPADLWTYIASAHRISWTLPADFTLNPGETTHFTFTARVTTTKEHYTINNAKSFCEAISVERLTPAKCIADLKLSVLSPLEKMVKTRNPPSTPNQTFPGRYITYTIYAYNPLQVPVSDLRITDTLPSEDFTFAGMVGGGPSPKGSPTSTIVWEGLSLPANGVISFAFHAFVDEQAPVKSNCGAREYKNTLTAASSAFPVVYETNRFSFDHVRVTKQIQLSKSRSPSEQLPGELVTYTIKIDNLGDTSVNIPILTDTLPIDFRYHSMVSGTPGEPAGQSDNVIWWDDIPTIGAGGSFAFSFRATVEGVPLAQYKNGVAGFSPDTYICSINTAAVKVLSPIVGSKEASPPYPEPIVQGEWLEYSVSYANRSSLRSYFVDQFVDVLPDGFFDEAGNPVYIFDISPATELQPDFANSWDHTFPVQVVGEGSGTPWCDNLASERGRKIYQAKGQIQIHTVDPDEYWLNPGKEAPVYIKPHVDLFQSYYPSRVGLNGITTVTLVLSNNLRNPARSVNGITLTYELPANFTYLGVVPGTPVPDVIGENLVWYGIDVPASDIVELHFQLQAPPGSGKYSGITSYAIAADHDICIPTMKGTLRVVKGVTLHKTPSPKEVGPFGTVEYNLEVANLTDAPAVGIRITDTLPYGFEFIEMTSEHTPVSLAPLVWEIPYMAGLAKENIRFSARAYVNLGPQYNYVDGVSASTYVTLAKTLEDYENAVRVDVVPGVGLYKTVVPTQTQAGQPVTYSINLYNGSSKNMASIVLTDTLPLGFSFGGMVEGPTPVASHGSLIVWKIDRLNRTESLQLVFRANTAPDLFSDLYYNQVSGEAWDAASPYDRIDFPSTDLTAPVVIQGLPNVQRSKSVSPSTVRAGNLVTYTITLYNKMDEPQTLRLTDTLPMSLTFDSVVAPTPAPVQTSPIVWDGLQIGAQETVTLVFKALVDLYTRSGTYYNRIDAASGSLKYPTRRLAPLQIEEIPRFDLQVAKSDDRVTVDEGDVLQYTVTYTNVNKAGLRLTNVVITDTFDPPPPYADWTGTGSDWRQVATNVYTHFVGDLDAGESGSVQFSLQLSDTIPTSVWVVSNTVVIDHSTDELAFETTPSNNRSTDLDILRGPDLIIAGLEVSPVRPTVGAPVTFLVTVRNQGKSETVNAAGHGWFLVELYLKGTDFVPAGPPVDVFDHYGGFWPDAGRSLERDSYVCVLDGLAADSEEICEFVITDVEDVDDYHVYVQADVSFDDRTGEPWGHDYGVVLEAIESNNVFFYDVIPISENRLYLPVVAKNR